MSVKLGFQGVLKYKIGGISAGGSFVTLGNVRDVSPSSSYSEIDVSTRADQGHEATIPGTRSTSLSIEMLVNSDDADYAALRAAHLDRTVVGIQVFDYDGGPGWQADMLIFSLEHSQGLSDVQTVTLNLKCASGATFSQI